MEENREGWPPLPDVTDPEKLYHAARARRDKLSAEMARLDEIVRTSVTAMYHTGGETYRSLSAKLELSVPRVGQLITETPARSRQFLLVWKIVHEKLLEVTGAAIEDEAFKVLAVDPLWETSPSLETLSQCYQEILHGCGMADDMFAQIIELAEDAVTDLMVWRKSKRRGRT
jgi:hypothetical protein